jgi:hypothetical protein
MKYDALHPEGAISVPLYIPIQGWSPAAIIRRLGFGFFGIYGTQLNTEFTQQAAEAIPTGERRSGGKGGPAVTSNVSNAHPNLRLAQLPDPAAAVAHFRLGLHGTLRCHHHQRASESERIQCHFPFSSFIACGHACLQAHVLIPFNVLAHMPPMHIHTEIHTQLRTHA